MLTAFNQKRPAFTLIELLLVIGIIAILAGVVISAINPTKQLGQANDVANQSKVRAISNALQQYYVEQGNWPSGLSETPQTICSSGGSGNCLSLDDAIVSTSFISDIPQAVGFNNPDSGFVVYIQDGAIEVNVKTTAELSPQIEQPARAYNFDGVDDEINLGNSANLKPGLGSMTWSYWLNPGASGNKEHMGDRLLGGNGTGIEGYSFGSVGSSTPGQFQILIEAADGSRKFPRYSNFYTTAEEILAQTRALLI